MKYTKLGRSDFEISRIGMGCWQAAGWSSSDDSEFIKTVRSALSSGITLFDTSPLYGNGHSETLLNKALESERSKVIIATKFFLKKRNLQEIRNSLEQSLRRLKTDYIDLYQHHWPTSKLPLDDIIGMLETLKNEGKIRAIGVCNWMEPEWEEFTNYQVIDSLQPCYSLLWRNIEKKVLGICVDNDINVLPYSPLCQGILTGKFRSPEEFPKDVRAQNVCLSKERFPKVLVALSLLDKLSKKYNKSLSQISLKWILKQAENISPLVGMSRPGQVQPNVDLFDWELADSDIELLSENTKSLSENLDAHDTLWSWHPKKTA